MGLEIIAINDVQDKLRFVLGKVEFLNDALQAMFLCDRGSFCPTNERGSNGVFMIFNELEKDIETIYQDLEKIQKGPDPDK